MSLLMVRAVTIVVLAASVIYAWIAPNSPDTAVPAGTAALKVEVSKPGNDFEVGAVGLSMEARELSSGRLTSRHVRLVEAMRLLGPAVLRIGGGSIDRSWWTSRHEQPPRWATVTVTPGGLSRLKSLLKATGWRVLLGVDLGHFEPRRVADEVRHARVTLGSTLLGIEIGNEPNDYDHPAIGLRPPTYSLAEYIHQASIYRDVIKQTAPSAAIYGPSLTRANAWLVQMGKSAQTFDTLTQHFYALNSCQPGVPAASLRATGPELIGSDIRAEEDQLLTVLNRASSIAQRPLRIDETNSVACPGGAAASPGFAGTLWALDWVLRSASAGAVGVNFHGDLGACAVYTESPLCAASVEDAKEGRLVAQAEFYGLLAARQLEGGRFVPSRLTGSGDQPDITTWATVAPDGRIKIAIDDLAFHSTAQPFTLATAGYSVTTQTLTAPSLTSPVGVTLGGAAITTGADWRPIHPMKLQAHRVVRLVVRPGSALIVTLRPKRADQSDSSRASL